MPGTSQLQHALRPDFQEWWPRFSYAHELEARLQENDIAVATLLVANNLSLYAELDPIGFEAWVQTFRHLNLEEKSAQITRVLRAVGIDADIASAFGSIDRSAFLPSRYKHVAFLNASIPLEPGSPANATMFGLCALVTQALKPLQPLRIIEVGFGSGLQAVGIMAALHDKVHYVGYELNQALSGLWSNGASPGNLSNIEVHWEAFSLDNIELRRGDVLLFSCSLNSDQYHLIKKAVSSVDGAAYLVPRPLILEEFNEVCRNGMLWWNNKPIYTYEEYLSDPRAYMVLTLGQNDHNLLREQNICFNIQYVMFQTSTDEHTNANAKLPRILETAFCD